MLKHIVTFYIFCLFALHALNVNADAKKYTISFVPQHSPSHLLKIWGPLVKAIEKETGVKLKLKVDSSIPNFESKLKNQSYDFSYMNPYHYTVFHSVGYEAMAKEKNKKIKGIFVTLENSSLKSISDINGHVLSFPSPNAFAATLLTEAKLRNLGIKYKANYVQSHDSVYANVEMGRHIAGGGINRTFSVYQAANEKSKVKVLWESKGYTPHAFTYHKRVPQEVVAKIQNALLNMKLETLRIAKIKNGFISATDSDWNDVRELKISK